MRARGRWFRTICEVAEMTGRMSTSSKHDKRRDCLIDFRVYFEEESRCLGEPFSARWLPLSCLLGARRSRPEANPSFPNRPKLVRGAGD